MRLGIALAALALAVSGCSGGTEAKAPKPVPKVSEQTTCDRMFTQGDPRLWSRATTLVAEQSNGETVDDAEAKRVKGELDALAASASAALKPHISTMSDTVAHLETASTGTYKTAATEVANECAAYVAVN